MLITTRDIELAVALDAHEIRLKELSGEESQLLFTNIVGEERVAREPEAAHEIFQLLGYLPLAVELAARKLVMKGRWRLADLAERLRDEQSRLDELAISDREVRSSFAVSWIDLKANLRRTFALLAVFEGRAFRASALAAVAGTNRLYATDHLDALVSSSMLSEEGEQHYRQHPLLADFAREHLGDNRDARRRMADFYLSYANEYQREYMALEQEKANLTAGMRTVYQLQAWEQVVAFASVMKEAWFARGLFSDARQGYTWACEAAERMGDQRILANHLSQLGQACIEQGDYEEAEKHLTRGKGIYEELEHKRGLGRVLYHLGRIAIERAKYGLAEELLGESRKIREEVEGGAGVAETLYRLANIPYRKGDYVAADIFGKQALTIQLDLGEKFGAIQSLNLLADCDFQRKDLRSARKHCQHALKFCKEIQERGELATTYVTLSKILRGLQLRHGARLYAEKSLALFSRMGDRRSQALSLYQLMIVDKLLQDYDAAIREGKRGLTLLEEIGKDEERIYILYQLGLLYILKYEPRKACEMWHQAVDVISGKLPDHPMRESILAKIDENCEK